MPRPALAALCAVLVAPACAPSDTKNAPSGSDSAGTTEAHGDSEATDSGADTPAPRTLTTGAHTLGHDGLTRDYRLHVPDDLPEGAPLVIAMHGYSSSARTLQRYSGLDERANNEGFVVAYPQGTTDRWGYAFWEVGYAFHDGSTDDVGFIQALATHIGTDLQTGPVFATGMSNGGDMSYLLACQAPELVTAVAPIAGSIMQVTADTCTPADPVPVLAVHGTADDVTLWAGDADNTGGWGVYLSVEDAIALHVELHGFETYAVEDLPDVDPTDGSTVRVHSWSHAGADEAVQLYEVVGGGHDWPGAFGNQDIHASDELWAFFARYR